MFKTTMAKSKIELLDDRQLLALYEEVYDRWNFETGSDEDATLMKAIDDEIKNREYLDEYFEIVSSWQTDLNREL